MREHEVESFGGSQTAEHVREYDQLNTPELRWVHGAGDIAVEHRSGPAPASAASASAEKQSLSLWSPGVGATKRHSSR